MTVLWTVRGGRGWGYGYGCVSVDVYVYHRPNLELACNVGCRLFQRYFNIDTHSNTLIISHQKCRHPTHSPPSPSTVRSRDHTVLYCTIVLYSTKIEKICLQTDKEQRTNKQTKNSNTETTLSLSSVDTRGSWPIRKFADNQAKNRRFNN